MSEDLRASGTESVTDSVTNAGQTLGELGENEALRRLLPQLPRAVKVELGPGDDAAVLGVPSGRLVLTTDTMLQGPDFRLAWSSGFDLGFKAAVSNLSDVVAMGAKPTALLIALGFPADTRLDFAEDFGRGVAAALAEHAPDCGIIGGDLTTSESMIIAVTAMGELLAEPVLRSGAEVGDTIAIAGKLGFAAAGIHLLFERALGVEGEPDAELAAVLKESYPEILTAQLRPNSPFQQVLDACEATAENRPTAMLDLSDGLLKDAHRIARASGVALQFDPDAIRSESEKLAAVVPEYAHLAESFVLSSGEDHGLLATFSSSDLPKGFRRLGTVTAGEPAVFVGETAVPEVGWDAFSQWDGNLG